MRRGDRACVGRGVLPRGGDRRRRRSRRDVNCDLFIAADLVDEASVAHLYARVRREMGHIDVLFNNAGIVSTRDGSVLTTELSASPKCSR